MKGWYNICNVNYVKNQQNLFYYLRDYSGLKYHVCEKCFKNLQKIKEIDENFICSNNILLSSDICLYFRETIGKWKQSTFAYKKALLGKVGNIRSINTAHHFYKRYYDLLINSFKFLNIEFKNNLEDYTTEELNSITELLVLLHWYYGQGCVMTEEHHKLYHQIYGKDKVSEKSIIDFYFGISDTYGKAYEKIISSKAET